MYPLLTQLSPLLKRHQIEIFDLIFKLHSRLTVIILLAFCLILSAKEYFGAPIDCLVDSKETHKKSFIDNYCWINGTYTLKNQPGNLGAHYPYFGVGEDNGDEILTQKYYQWVVIILLLQAALFYFPSYLWKIWESGRLVALCGEFGSPLLQADWNTHKARIVEYLQNNNSFSHNLYAFRFFFCEMLNFAAIIINIIIIHVVIPNFWYEYNTAVLALFTNDWHLWEEKAARVFPKVTKCRYYEYGPSGSIQRKDSLCLQSSNIINDKIFAFLWIWLIVLALISGLHIIYRFLTILCKCVRIRAIHVLAHPFSPSHRQIKSVTNNLNIGDWFVMCQLGRNLNPYAFRDIIIELTVTHKNVV